MKAEYLMKDNSARTVLTAFFTFVAMDKQRKPCSVDGLIIETYEERLAFEEEKRYQAQKKQVG